MLFALSNLKQMIQRKQAIVIVSCFFMYFGWANVSSANALEKSFHEPKTHEVIMLKMRFVPAELTIYQGDTVRWVNREKRQYHNVWFEALGEEEPDYLFPEEQIERRFDQQGDYPYRCGPHPLMLAKIIVLPRESTEVISQSVSIHSQTELSETRQKELMYLLKQDCGSCHGMKLLGGLGPSLLPENVASSSVEDLMAVILHGRPGTAMPPWKNLLSEADARWLSEQLKEGASLDE